MSLLIRCTNLEKTYKSKNTSTQEESFIEALKGVSFEMHEGDRIGLIGLNGSGKSTLLKILSGIIKPSGGRVELHKNVQNLSGSDSILHPDMTGRENAVFQLRILGLNQRGIGNAIEEIIAFSELGNFIDEPVKTYSSGMMLRLSFSIFNVIKPEILLLDEVLSAGDMKFQKKAEALINEHLSKASGIILASHQLVEVSGYCNKCIILNNGSIDFIGSVEQALTSYLTHNNTPNISQYNSTELRIDKVVFDKPNNQYFRSDKITITIYVTLFTSLDDIFPSIYIANYLGNILTDCERYRENTEICTLENGEWIFKVEIPQELFNIGVYNVSLIIGQINKKIVEAKNIELFTVVADSWESNINWEIPTNYPIRPNLIWSKTKNI